VRCSALCERVRAKRLNDALGRQAFPDAATDAELTEFEANGPSIFGDNSATEAWRAAEAALRAALTLAPTAAASHHPSPEVLAAAVELRRLAETPTGRDAAKARAAWSAHLKNCRPCRAWSKAQDKAPRGTIAAASEECPEERRLMAAANAAEKAHTDAQEKRKALPLVLAAWVEALA
jgi:hypothetical protein